MVTMRVAEETGLKSEEENVPLSLYISPLAEYTTSMWGASSLRDTMAPDRDRAPRGFWCLLCSFTKYCRMPASKSSTKYLCGETTARHSLFCSPLLAAKEETQPRVNVKAPDSGGRRPKVPPGAPPKVSAGGGRALPILKSEGALMTGRRGQGEGRLPSGPGAMPTASPGARGATGNLQTTRKTKTKKSKQVEWDADSGDTP